MSGTNTGRAARTDAEWARDTNRRLAALENPDAARVGEWVISSKNGQLVATKQGDQIIIGNSEVTATEFTDAIRGVHRDVEKVDEKATDAQETADNATPLDQFSKLLDAAKDAGEGVLTGGLGGGLLDAAQGFLNIFNLGKAAQTQATAAQNSADAAVQTVGITSGTIGVLKWTRTFFATTGTTTWTVPTPTPGYQLERVDIQVVGPGQGGPKPPLNYLGKADGGLAGGFARRSFTPAEIGPAGTVYNLVLPAGTAGATSTGPAALPARATVTRADTSALLIQSPAPGTSGIYMTAGIPSTFQAPGNGGGNGPAVYIGDDSNGNSVYSYTDGEPGDPSLEAVGGTPGRGPTGWFGSGSVAPGNGADAPTSDPYYRFCGSGGGGGVGRVNAPGGNGGNPGGGAGAGSVNNAAPFLPAATNGGTGGRSEIVFWVIESPLPPA